MNARSTVVPIAIFAVTAAVGGAVVWQAERLFAAGERESAAHVAAGAAFGLEQEVSRALAATYTLAAFVHHDPTAQNFETMAAEVLPLHPGVSSLQLAPDAVIRRVYPLRGNEAALGHDLRQDPERRLEAIEALTSRRLTVAGPFQLRQGGLGLVGRLAVFLPAPDASGGEKPWGLVAAVIRVPPLLEVAQLHRVEDAGYRYRLTRMNPERRAEECFAGCDRPLAAEPVEFGVAVPNGSWTLSIAPGRGWPRAPWRTPAWVLVVLSSAALALLARKVLELPARLEAEVASRTAELARAHAELAEDMARLRAAESAARVAEEQLRHAQKMEAVGRLAGGVAHDFNNLLTGILGHASVLVEVSPSASEAHEAAVTIETAARRAAELTRQLLHFSRRRPLAAVSFDAHEVLRQVVRLLQRTLDARVRIEVALDAPRSVVSGDPGQLEQAVLNLAVNSRDAMPDGGTVRITTAVVERDGTWAARHPGAEPGTYLAISVEDGGHGIPADLRERIFEPFFTTKEQGRGTGLGLATVYAVAQAHRGGADVESEVGRGSRFTLSFPLAGDGSAPSASRLDRPRVVGTGRVLVIDDDPIPRGATAAMLRAAGYEPVEAGSGEEGLRWIRAHGAEVRAIVLDVAMPGMDGVTCFERLRECGTTAPVVFISGYARDARAPALAEAGEAAFLSKPFDGRDLAAAIEGAAAGRTVASRERPAGRV